MELALSLGNRGVGESSNTSVSFCMGLSSSTNSITARSTAEKAADDHHKIIKDDDQDEKREKVGSSSSSDPTAVVSPRQLDLLPFSPVPRSAQPTLRFPWLSDNLSSEPGSSDGPRSRIMEVNRRAAAEAMAEEVEEQSSPNSGTSSFMEFSLYTNGGGKRSGEHSNNNNNNENVQGLNGGGGGGSGEQMTTSRGSDDEENGCTRKKLRLSKDQSAFLEESFKEHHTLNPKQKLALAKQLNLRPRQVEVWFQNRRARTKLKQTEVDCEYLKRCCETLTEENRRLQKELQELRALKTSQPFFMQLPATTLTMCPSCERVAPTSTSVPAGSAPPNTTVTVASKPTVSGVASGSASGATLASTSNATTTTTTLSLGKPKQPMLPFNNAQAHQAAS